LKKLEVKLQLSRQSVSLRKEHWESSHGVKCIQLLTLHLKKWESSHIPVGGIEGIYLLHWLLGFTQGTLTQFCILYIDT
jgi:hypothetical protein